MAPRLQLEKAAWRWAETVRPEEVSQEHIETAYRIWLEPYCREGLLCQQQRDLREYTQATIYVHKVVDNKKVMKDSAPELNVSSSETEEDKEEAKPDGEKDPDFNQSNGSTKRQKTSQQGYVAYQKQVIRRSTRHRKVRGEKALLVSANQTLKELKIQIMHAFSVAPFDVFIP